MAYVLLPNSGQSLGQTRAQIRENFNLIQTTIDANHVSVSSGNGKHKFLQMPEQGAAPTTAANEGGLYTKEASTITNLFWRLENNGTEVQMTNVAPSNAANGYTFLPGGLLIQWNLSTINASTTTIITFPITFSSTAYSVVVTPIRNASNVDIVYVVSQAAATFTVRNTASGITQCNWIAIGTKV